MHDRALGPDSEAGDKITIIRDYLYWAAFPCQLLSSQFENFFTKWMPEHFLAYKRLCQVIRTGRPDDARGWRFQAGAAGAVTVRFRTLASKNGG
jgi:hypothetical protein